MNAFHMLANTIQREKLHCLPALLCEGNLECRYEAKPKKPSSGLQGMESPSYGAESSALPQGLISSILCLWRCSSKHFLGEGQSLLPRYSLAGGVEEGTQSFIRRGC